MAKDVLTAEQIKAIRIAIGMTQEEFGSKLGVTIRAVSYWESGERTPGGPASKMICQLYRDYAGKPYCEPEQSSI